MPTVYVNGQRLYYQILGAGEPLLLMHGWMHTGAMLHGLAEVLAADYQVYLPDLPGYGRSVAPYRQFPNDFYQRDADLMIGFLDALNVPRARVMGFSDGGEVALVMGTRISDRCHSVITWGASGALDPGLCKEVRKRLLPPNWIADSLRMQHSGQNIDQWPGAWVDTICKLIAAGGNISLDHAADLRAPLLMMLGDQDYLNSVRIAQQFIQAGTAGADRRLEVFRGVGHPIHEERPGPFIDTVRVFLRQYRGS